MTGRVGEFEYIRSRLAPLSADAQGSATLTDDGALLDLGPGERLAVTADTLIEGRHFPKDENPELAARKALRVNLSDLAAMGARPFAYTSSVVWPQGDFEACAAGFVRGLQQDQEAFGMRLIGGDTTRANAPWTISITAFGRVPDGQSLRRNRARNGDLLVVTGTIGDAGLGLDLLTQNWTTDREDHRAFALARYRLPEPRIKVGLAARGRANAAIDISDGLLSEAHHLAVESGLQAIVDLQLMPLSAAARDWLEGRRDVQKSLVDLASRGDDYELLLAVPEGALSKLSDQCSAIGIPLSVIGHLRSRQASDRLKVVAGSKAIAPARLGFTQF